MPTGRSNSRARSSARKDVIQMLVDDHERARKAFRDFDKLDPADDPERCQALVERTCGELQIHAALEEELFYPAARAALKEADLIEEAEIEHLAAKQLIEQLQTMTPEEPKFAAAFKVLGEYVRHHIREEENELFPRLERARIGWEALLGEMTARREELTDLMLPAMAGDAIAWETVPRDTKRGLDGRDRLAPGKAARQQPLQGTRTDNPANAGGKDDGGLGTAFSDDADGAGD